MDDNMNNFNERINLTFDLSIISKKICDKYVLGNYQSNELIQNGYEDYNYVLTTTKDKYFIKIFSKDRIQKEIDDYINKIKEISCIPINYPKLIVNELIILKIGQITFKLCIFEYINGSNYFQLKQSMSNCELIDLVKQVTVFQNIKDNSDFIYDSWGVNNFIKEYELKKQSLPNQYIKVFNDLINEYKSIDLSKLSYSFVHGDIRSTNIMKDVNNKIWIIDFAVSNYLPRIIDLAVIASDLCIKNDIKETVNRIKLVLDIYQEKVTT